MSLNSLEEQKPLLSSVASGALFGPEELQRPRTTRLSIYLMIFITFLSNVVFAIVLPSMPQYFLDVHASEDLMGWAVAANSLGSFIAGPLIGLWADRRGVKEVSFVTLALLAASNVWYGLAKDAYQIIISRFFVGVAAANGVASNAFLSYATTPDERALILTLDAAAGVFGFICGPGFSAITSLKALQFKSINLKFITLNITAETSPGFISAIFAMAAIFILIPFKEVDRSLFEAKKQEPSCLDYFRVYKVSILGFLIIMFANFSFTTSFTIFETIGSIYTAKNPNLKFKVFENSITFAAVAGVALVAIALLQLIMRFLIKSDRINLIGFSVFVTAGMSTLVEWHTGYMLEGIEQGVMMGWLSSSGSIARMICPVAASYMWSYVGPKYLFLSIAIMTGISNCLMIAFYKLLEPRVVPEVVAVNY